MKLSEPGDFSRVLCHSDASHNVFCRIDAVVAVSCLLLSQLTVDCWKQVAFGHTSKMPRSFLIKKKLPKRSTGCEIVSNNNDVYDTSDNEDRKLIIDCVMKTIEANGKSACFYFILAFVSFPDTLN